VDEVIAPKLSDTSVLETLRADIEADSRPHCGLYLRYSYG
jgi:hypothetical protein